MVEKKRLCFVCLGNIVRSPLAEHMFLYQAQKMGVSDKYEVGSAGTGSWNLGHPPDGRMKRVAAAHGLVYDGRARQLLASDFDRFDLFLVMDNENYQDVMEMAIDPEQRRKIHMLREFDPQGGDHAVVPDPYYSDIHSFEEVYRIIERSIRGLLDTLEGKSVINE